MASRVYRQLKLGNVTETLITPSLSRSIEFRGRSFCAGVARQQTVTEQDRCSLPQADALTVIHLHSVESSHGSTADTSKETV